MPPMKIRNSEAHKQEARQIRAVIDGYTMVPVFSYLPNSIYDDVNQKGCYYVDQCIQNQITDPKYYAGEGK